MGANAFREIFASHEIIRIEAQAHRARIAGRKHSAKGDVHQPINLEPVLHPNNKACIDLALPVDEMASQTPSSKVWLSEQLPGVTIRLSNSWMTTTSKKTAHPYQGHQEAPEIFGLLPRSPRPRISGQYRGKRTYGGSYPEFGSCYDHRMETPAGLRPSGHDEIDAYVRAFDPALEEEALLDSNLQRDPSKEERSGCLRGTIA